MTILTFIGPDRVLPAHLAPQGTDQVEPSRDSMVLETSLRLRDAGTGAQVVVVSPDTGDADGRLRSAIEVGANDALRLAVPPSGFITLNLAAAVLETAADVGARLVVVRNRTSPLESCLVASVLGEIAGWPALTGVVDVEAAAPDRLLVHRKVAGEIEQLSCPLPAILAIERGPGLRYPTGPGRLRARRADLQLRSVSDQPDLSGGRPTADAVVLPKPLRKPAPDSAPGERRAMAVVMGSSMEAGTGGGTVLEGDPAEIAAGLAQACRRAIGRASGS